MSEQPGLSIFESASRPGESTFPMARRGGYDTDAVDTFLRSRANDVQQADQRAQAAQAEAANLRAELEKTKAAANDIEHPTYATLGGRRPK